MAQHKNKNKKTQTFLCTTFSNLYFPKLREDVMTWKFFPHYLHFVRVSCKRTFYYNDSKITEFKTIDTKNSSTAYVVMYKLIT